MNRVGFVIGCFVGLCIYLAGVYICAYVCERWRRR